MKLSKYDLLLVGAMQGKAKFQTDIGVCYLFGDDVEIHYGKARMWLSKAAEQEDADAFFFLGQIYYFGLDVAQNDKEAIAMFSKAIELGNKDAQKFMEEKNLI